MADGGCTLRGAPLNGIVPPRDFRPDTLWGADRVLGCEEVCRTRAEAVVEKSSQVQSSKTLFTFTATLITIRTSLMKSLPAWTRASVSLLFLCACSSESGGPARTTVGAELESSTGTPPAVCVRLPVLLGSQTEASVPVGSAFEISVHALRHTATITFPGARNDATATRNVSLTQLTSGYADVVTVTGSDGVDYRVRVLSGCSETLPEDP